MAKVAMLLPKADMLPAAAKAAVRYGLNLVHLSVISPEQIPDVVPAVMQNQPDIIIARGLQASKIRALVDIPVVEIKITSYEISRLVQKAKAMTPIACPRIFLMGPGDIFVPMDMDEFNRQHNAELQILCYWSRKECDQVSASMIEEKATDVIIGATPSEEMQAFAQEHGIVSLRLEYGSQEIWDACRIAQSLSDALDLDKAHAASLNLLLNHIPSGIMQLDSSGCVLRTNSFVEHLLFLEPHAIKGRPIWELLPGITEQMLQIVLDKQKEIHKISIKYGRSEFLIHITPIITENKTTGAIVTFREGRPVKDLEKKQIRELVKQGYAARHTFDRFINRSPQMKKLCEQARHFASFQFPILILGPLGTEKQYLAECIHNSSSFKDYPFFRFSCSGYEQKDAEQLLFGHLSGGEKPDYSGPCTLFLKEVADLSLYAQYQLLHLIQDNATTTGSPSGNSQPSKLRVIMSSQYHLPDLIRQGKFRKDLYYLISVASLQVPPLAKRREDIMGWVDYQMQSLFENYGRYMKFTRDAQEYLTGYDWPGNIIELRAVCNRLMINCPKYYVDAADVEEQIRILTGEMPADPLAEVSSPREASDTPKQQIIQALIRHEGNREAAAADLQISVSTLWRRMKKYKIQKATGKMNG